MYLQRRNRILRANRLHQEAWLQKQYLTPNDFIAPLFIDEGENVASEIPSMPGYYQTFN